ncbi:MAG: hypothetical protein HUK02_09090, partial [Bacteroidaceae bacterium]|nr:hypothetical protein [Bacteroidaceae bacterium]
LARTPQPKLSEGESNADFNTRLGQWRSAMRGATVYYSEALDYAREARVDKQYLADVYYGMTDCYRKAQEFDSARNTLAMVTETYSAYSPERVENMKQAIDRGASVKAQNEAAYRARLQSNSKQLAEYNRRQEALRRKQRAEDAFWRGK